MTINETIKEMSESPFNLHFQPVETTGTCQNCGMEIEDGLNRCGTCLYPTGRG